MANHSDGQTTHCSQNVFPPCPVGDATYTLDAGVILWTTEVVAARVVGLRSSSAATTVVVQAAAHATQRQVATLKARVSY